MNKIQVSERVRSPKIVHWCEGVVLTMPQTVRYVQTYDCYGMHPCHSQLFDQ